jgi:hypothetical protein
VGVRLTEYYCTEYPDYLNAVDPVDKSHIAVESFPADCCPVFPCLFKVPYLTEMHQSVDLPVCTSHIFYFCWHNTVALDFVNYLMICLYILLFTYKVKVNVPN